MTRLQLPTSSPKRMRWAANALLIVPIGLALSSCLCTQPRAVGDAFSTDGLRWFPATVTLPRDWLWPTLASSAAASAIVLALLTRSPWRRGLPSLVPSILTSIAVLLTLWVGDISHRQVGTWRLVDERTGRDSRSFAVLEIHFFDGPQRVFAVRAGTGAFKVSYVGLDSGSGELVTVVRPADDSDSTRKVYFGSKGLVLALDVHACWAAWDPVRRQALSDDAVSRLSPFVLIGDTGSGRDNDVDFIVATCRSNGDPKEALLLADLNHANPWVRNAARRIVEAGGAEMYPEATRRLADAPK